MLQRLGLDRAARSAYRGARTAVRLLFRGVLWLIFAALEVGHILAGIAFAVIFAWLLWTYFTPWGNP